MQAQLITKDLLYSSQLTAIAGRNGWSVTVIDPARAVAGEDQTTDLWIVDLSALSDDGQWQRVFDQLARGTSPILAFGPHVHQARLEAAKKAGCRWVMTRGQLHREADRFFQQWDQQMGPGRGQSP